MDDLKFRWTWLGSDVGGREVVYQLGGTEVARLIDRLGGSWFAILDRQGEHERKRDCTSYEAGRRGVELWAARHEARLRAEVLAKHEAWLSRQTWRGSASLAARAMVSVTQQGECSSGPGGPNA
jgi:hypothetical protein